MTHWDVPSPGSWDDPYGDPHSHRDEAPATGDGAGRHAAGEYDHEDGTFNGFTPRRRSADDGYAGPARPVSPARPGGRPVSPARPPAGVYQPPMGQPDAWNLPPQPL